MASFMEVLGDRDRKDSQLVASGSVVEMRYRRGAAVVSARAQKLYHLLIKGVGPALTSRVPFHAVPLASVRDLAHISNADLKDIAEELVRTTVEVRTSGPKGATAIGGLLSFVSIDNDSEGVLQFAFSEPMIRVFELDNRWTVINREILLGLESKYSIRLYEMLVLRGGYRRKEEDFSLSDFRDRLGVSPDKVKQFGHFKSDVLQPAIQEIHLQTGRLIEWEAIKSGRAVTRIKVIWPGMSLEDGDVVIDALPEAAKAVRKETTKAKAAPRQARPEKASPKVELPKIEPVIREQVTPSARTCLPKTVDDISTPDAFPASGSIHFSAWADLIRFLLPTDTPDVDFVAQRFREFMAKGTMPPAGLRTRRAFVTFVSLRRYGPPKTAKGPGSVPRH